MDYFKVAAYGLAICSQLTYAGFTLAETPTASDRRGTIGIMDKDKHQCFIPVPEAGQTVVYPLSITSPCESNTARDIEFNEIPSATTILLTDSPFCNTNDLEENFWFRFKTIKKSTTTDYIELEYFKSYVPGSIVRPGLVLTDRWLKPGHEIVRDRLSCIAISTSAAPPSSVTETSAVPAQP
ncbi:hypothetical protein [Pseudomonas sp. IT-P176]|uniref:hypothetical protein n=1 Tax=Pseudomonas sp. IT-P176 TaxID=3026444 RepID=UPI0039E1F6A5